MIDKELKTLKDLGQHQSGGTDCILTWELKAEAVKWIKRSLNEREELNNHDWMKFHNLTEEDLK